MPQQARAGLKKRTYAALYRVRRRIATALGIVLALVLTYHVVFGRNGVNNYEQKRVQNKKLQSQIETLQKQNQQLKTHNARLKDDPDAITFEAREKLHYAKPGEVIYSLNSQPQAGNSEAAAPAQSQK